MTLSINKALVIGSERLSLAMDWQKRESCFLFGDGAGSVVIEATEREGGLLAGKMSCVPDSRECLRLPNWGMSPAHLTGDLYISLDFDGAEIFKSAVKGMSDAISDVLEKEGLTAADIDLFVPHQANIRIIQSLAKRLNFPMEKVVVAIDKYANTSAAVKARADWVVTSSIALDVAEHLAAQDKKIIWAPDRHLGDYVRRSTGADMLMWDGACIVHEEFKARGIADLKQVHPEAAVLVHPESPASVIEMADHVGSTTQIIKAAQAMPHETFIVATDQGIFFKLQQAAPEKTFLIAPTAGNGATCRSCANCPWMAMNILENLHSTLRDGVNEIHVDAKVARQALVPLERMVNFSKTLT